MSVNRTPEQEARESIDRMLDLAGWDVHDRVIAEDLGDEKEPNSEAIATKI
jgi:type I site-specific restriction endonuclease